MSKLEEASNFNMKEKHKCQSLTLMRTHWLHGARSDLRNQNAWRPKCRPTKCKWPNTRNWNAFEQNTQKINCNKIWGYFYYSEYTQMYLHCLYLETCHLKLNKCLLQTLSWKKQWHQSNTQPINYLLSKNTMGSELQNLKTPNIWAFCSHKPNILSLTYFLLSHYLWPKQIQKDPKYPNFKFIFTKKWENSCKTPWLPTGDLFRLPLFRLLKIERPLTWYDLLKSTHLKGITAW